MSRSYYDDIDFDDDDYAILFHDCEGDYSVVTDDYDNLSDDNVPDFTYIEVKTKNSKNPLHIYIGKEGSLEEILFAHQEYDSTIDDVSDFTDTCLNKKDSIIVIIENDVIPTPSGKPGAYIMRADLDIVVDSKEKAVRTAKDIVKNWLETTNI